MPLPLFSSPVAAGFPSPADDHLESKLDLNELLIKNPTATYFLRVNGDSWSGPVSLTKTYWWLIAVLGPELARSSSPLLKASLRLNAEMVRLRRLELPRGISPTATSTLRVYQFRHSRTRVGGPPRSGAVRANNPRRCNPHLCSHLYPHLYPKTGVK